MKTTARFAALVAVVLLVTGCATVFDGDTDLVFFESNPPGAEVMIDGRPVGNTPVAVNLDVRRSYNVQMRHEGGEASGTITKQLNVGWVILDIVCGLFPVIVDAITGDWNNLEPNPFYLDLR